MLFFQAFCRRSEFSSIFQFSKLLAPAAVFLLLGAPLVFAEETPSSAAKDKIPSAVSEEDSETSRMTRKQQLRQKIMEIRQLQQKQQKIHQEVLQNNPKLKKQGKNYSNLVQKTLAGNLAAEGVDIQHLKTLQKKLQGQDLVQEEKSALSKEFRQKAKKYQQIRRETLNSPQITEKREDLVAGIEEKSPRAVEISREIASLRQEIRQCYVQLQQQQQ